MAAARDLVLALVLGYAAIAVLVWLAQERLMFFPRAALGSPKAPAGWQLEEVRITVGDGTALRRRAHQDSRERAVLLVNYRGYGKSSGSPGEKPLVADAIEIYDWAAKRDDVDPARIAVHGRSLGSGVAVQLAAARPVRCAVLTTPFSSALDVARSAYPWLPVSLLMRHPFDSMAHAPSLKVPALVLIGEADRVIPVESSERLAAAWGGTVERLRLPGFGHNDIGLHPRYNAAIRAFLDRNL